MLTLIGFGCAIVSFLCFMFYFDFDTEISWFAIIGLIALFAAMACFITPVFWYRCNASNSLC